MRWKRNAEEGREADTTRRKDVLRQRESRGKKFDKV